MKGVVRRDANNFILLFHILHHNVSNIFIITYCSRTFFSYSELIFNPAIGWNINR